MPHRAEEDKRNAEADSGIKDVESKILSTPGESTKKPVPL
jgi:hypothetical protein